MEMMDPMEMILKSFVHNLFNILLPFSYHSTREYSTIGGPSSFSFKVQEMMFRKQIYGKQKIHEDKTSWILWQRYYLLIKCTATDFGAVDLLTISRLAHPLF